MTQFLEFLVLGVSAGGVYALLGLGLVVIYRGSGVVNFAHGAIALLGAAFFYEFRPHLGTPLAIIVAVAAGAVFGVLIQAFVMRPMRSTSPLMRVIATLGIFTALEIGAEIRYGTILHFVSSWLPANSLSIGPVIVGQDRVIVLGIVVVLTVVLTFLYRRTRFGLATTGVVENSVATSSMGWSPNFVAMGNWVIGSALAAFAGVVLVPLTGLVPSALAETVVPGLAAALVGGFASFPLTLIGGLAIGMLESEATNYIHQVGWSTAVSFLVIIALLVLRGRPLPLRSELNERLPKVGSGRGRLRTGIPLIIVALISLEAFGSSWIAAFTTSCVFGILCLSLVIVTGYCGQLSLAQYALAGVGALIAGQLADAGHMTFLLALLLGVVMTVPIGLLIALPAVRVRGVNLAIVTMGLAIVLDAVVFQNPSYTGGGVTGIVIPDPRVFGADVSSVVHPLRYAEVALVALLIGLFIVANIRRGDSGRGFIAVRDNERAAASLSINPALMKLYAFGVGAGLAALAGIIGAFTFDNLAYTQYDLYGSINSLLYSVVGGVGYVSGALVGGGGAAAGVTQDVLAKFFNISSWYTFITAIILITVVLTNPDGIVSKLIAQFDFVTGPLVRATARLRPSARRSALSSHRSLRAAEVEADAERVTPRTLQVTDLTVRFGGVTALSGVACSVGPGEIVGLIGPNGAGKSTFIDAATGFNRAYGGVVSLDGMPMDRLRPSRRARLGVVRSFQSLELFEDLTVLDNLRVSSTRRGIRLIRDLVWPATRPLSGYATAAIKEFELVDVLDRLPGDLPYGVRRLVAIARAAAAGPSILLLDEPAAGLEDSAVRELAVVLRRLATEWGMGILLVEHHVSMVMETCDRVVALEFGRVLAEGTAEEVRTHQAVIDAYLGAVEEEAVEKSMNQAHPIQPVEP